RSSVVDQTNAISGRIKKGKDTIATIDGYWDGKMDIKDKKTGEESNLLDVALLKDQRLPRYLMSLEQQHEYESQRLWLKVSEAIDNDDQVAATEQKTIIEEAQRSRARNLVAPWVPRFFHKDLQTQPPDGVIDQGWKYNHINTNPWQPEEVLEYEEEFVIRSLQGSDSIGPVAAVVRERERSQGGSAHRLSDSDSHEDAARRSKASSRTLKQTLHAIDTTLRDHTTAIQRLTKTIESMSEGQRTAVAFRPHNVGRPPAPTHTWELLGGFVLALVLQALLNWIFHLKD
ncbi:LOW QUALITY PROTEIN: oxysterol-binding protein-related protein 8-like, partial [Aphomia sociella]